MPESRDSAETNFVDEGAQLKGHCGQVPKWLFSAASLEAVGMYAWIQCRYGGLKGGIFPSQETLAKELGLSTSAVSRRPAELKSAGALVVKRRGQGLTNFYTLKWIQPKKEN